MRTYKTERTSTLIVGQESTDSPIKINVGPDVRAVTFSANGEYLLSGGKGGIQVWQMGDGKQMATMKAKEVYCLAVSNDGRWIAAGTHDGDVYVWDAETREQAWSHRESDTVNTVDFSPNSTRLVTGLDDGKATIWDVVARKQVQTLDHESYVCATKYSAQGDRLATGTRQFVRVWDNDGRLLVTIKVGVVPYYNTGLLWSNNHIFALSDGQIKQFEASSTESAVSEWPVPNTSLFSCITLPKRKAFIAYSTNRTVTLWDTTTRTQLSLIEDTQYTYSIAISPDDQFLAIGGGSGHIIIRNLAHITVSFVYR